MDEKQQESQNRGRNKTWSIVGWTLGVVAIMGGISAISVVLAKQDEQAMKQQQTASAPDNSSNDTSNDTFTDTSSESYDNSSRFTMENYNKIDSTYTLDMVNNLFGFPGTLQGTNPDGTQDYTWSPPFSTNEVVLVRFKNGHEVFKDETGLEYQTSPTGVVGMTQANFEAIDSTYTVDMVNKLFGIDGTLDSEAGQGTGYDLQTYTWTDPTTGAIVTVTFENGHETAKSAIGLH